LFWSGQAVGQVDFIQEVSIRIIIEITVEKVQFVVETRSLAPNGIAAGDICILEAQL